MARSKPNGRASKATSYQPLTRNDLAAFDQEAKKLIMAAIEAGCTGRISSRGHCILRNNAGGTSAIPHNMTSPNRTAQNARADIKRMLAEHVSKIPASAAAAASRAPEQTTVARAFVDYGSGFSRWFDAHPGGLPADTPLQVSFDAWGSATFEVLPSPTTGQPGTRNGTDTGGVLETDSTAIPQVEVETGSPKILCLSCGRSYATAVALDAHRRVHRRRAASIQELALANSLTRTAVRTRLIETGATT